jgi:hypothetical protein
MLIDRKRARHIAIAAAPTCAPFFSLRQPYHGCRPTTAISDTSTSAISIYAPRPAEVGAVCSRARRHRGALLKRSTPASCSTPLSVPRAPHGPDAGAQITLHTSVHNAPLPCPARLPSLPLTRRLLSRVLDSRLVLRVSLPFGHALSLHLSHSNHPAHASGARLASSRRISSSPRSLFMPQPRALPPSGCTRSSSGARTLPVCILGWARPHLSSGPYRTSLRSFTCGVTCGSR